LLAQSLFVLIGVRPSNVTLPASKLAFRVTLDGLLGKKISQAGAWLENEKNKKVKVKRNTHMTLGLGPEVLKKRLS